jgi:hypothetical protein
VSLNAHYLTLHCSGKTRGVQVKVQYDNPNQPDTLMTVGTLHIAHPYLVVLITCLRGGGMQLTLTGPYLRDHPHLHRIGKH